MKKKYTRAKTNHLPAVVGLALILGVPSAQAGLIADLDLRNLGAEGAEITSITNAAVGPGNVGDFSFLVTATDRTTVPGVVATMGGVTALSFDGGSSSYTQYTASAPSISGASPYSATAWVYNPSLGAAETIIAWGQRIAGENMAFGQGTSATFGAVGHFTDPYDVGWGDTLDINATTGVWTHLATSYNGTTETVYINGAVANTKDLALLVKAGVPMMLGGENNNDLGTRPRNPFSGLIGSVKVWDESLDSSQIAADYALGIPEPSVAILGLAGLLSFGLRRRR